MDAHDFILPLFVSEKVDKRRPIASMPGVFQFSVKEIADEARAALGDAQFERAYAAGQALTLAGVEALLA